MAKLRQSHIYFDLDHITGLKNCNMKMFWKEVKRVRKGEQAREEMVKDVSGQILRDGGEVRRRWEQYYEQVLNVADVREANILM